MGGFATNGVNMTKLESYQLEGSFKATQFYADIEGHPASRNVRLALEELEFFTNELKILGVYPAHNYRVTLADTARCCSDRIQVATRTAYGAPLSVLQHAGTSSTAERRVGKEGVSTCRTRWWPSTY